MAPILSAFSSGSLTSSLSSRDTAGSNFQSTPVEAVVVPVALIILLLTGAAIASVVSYWRRRNDRDRLIKAAAPEASRKLVPEWLGNWMGSANAKPMSSPRSGPDRNLDERNSGFRAADHVEDSAKLGTADLADANSDTVALRPASVYLPPYPLMVYDPQDRYPGVRPKLLGVQSGVF